MAIKFGDMFDEAFSNAKLEEVLNKTKDVAETMSKKSAERLELGRKKVELLDSKAKLSKLYEKFGELQYSAVIGEEYDEAQAEEYIISIGEYKEKIKSLSEEIDAAKAAFNESAANAAKYARDAWNDLSKNKPSADTDNTISEEDIIVSGEEAE